MSGPIIKTATLHTNDPVRPAIVLTLAANILANANGSPVSGAVMRQGKYVGPLYISPSTRWDKLVSPGQPGRIEFGIEAEKEPVKVLRVEGGSLPFSARLETLVEGRRYKVVVDALPQEKAGSHEVTLRLSTDNAALPHFNLKVSISVR